MPSVFTSSRWLRGVVPVAALTLYAATVRARPSAVLDYERAVGAQNCPDELEFREQVSTRLGFDPFTRDAPLRVEARLTHTVKGFHGSIRALDEHGTLRGERHFVGASCPALVETIAVTVSILLDPKSFGAPGSKAADQDIASRALDSPPARSTLPGETKASNRAEAERALAPPAASSGDTLAVRLGAEAHGSFGAAPTTAIGALALLGMDARGWSLDLEGRIDAPVERLRADGSGVRSSLLLAQVVPCVHQGWVVVCSVAAAGALNGEGVQVDAPRRHSTFYAAFGVRLGLEAPFGEHLALRIHSDVGAPITRTTLNDRGQDVWTTPALFVSAGLGLVAHFP